MEWTVLWNAVHSNIHVQIALHSLGRLEHSRVVGQKERTQPHRIDVHQTVEFFAAFLQGAGRNQKILNYVIVFVQLLYRFRLSELQQGNLHWQQPAEQVTEDDIVPEWHDVL